MPYRKKILVIDSNDLHCDLLRESLTEALPVLLTRTPNLEKGLSLLKRQRFDLILTEYFDEHPQWLTKISEYAQGSPILVLTTKNNEAKVVAAMKMGADDYLIKNRESLNSLPRVLIRAIEKKKKSSPMVERKKGPFEKLVRHINTITDLVNRSSGRLTRGKGQLHVLEKEIETLTGIVKNWMHSR